MPVSLLPSAVFGSLSADAPTPDVELVFAESPTQVSTLCKEPLKASGVSWSFTAFDTQIKTTLNDVGCCVLVKAIDDCPADSDTLERGTVGFIGVLLRADTRS